LILAAYPYNEANTGAFTKMIGNVKNWNLLMDLIYQHGITALAHYNINEAGVNSQVPATAMAQLENGYLQSLVRNSWLTERWKETNEILCSAGIKHILLKGMALEHTLYEKKGLRQMSDNDILIKKDEALKAWNLLKKNGFESEALKSNLHNSILINTGKHLPTLYRDGYALEIHTRLFAEPSPDINEYREMFDKATEIKVNNTTAFILPEKIHLSYLIRHFRGHIKEGNCQLKNYSDIRLLDPANNLEFPEDFLYEPDQSMKKIFRKAGFRADILSVTAHARIRYLTGDIFPSVQWMKKRYNCPAAMTIFHYPKRLGKLLWLV